MVRTIRQRGQAKSGDMSDRGKWLVLVAMVFGLFMPMLDNLVVNVALPTIQRRLGAGFSGLAWVIDAYTLTFASLMLTGGLSETSMVGSGSSSGGWPSSRSARWPVVSPRRPAS
jgi:MFS family permease